jgi:hypothetical protein
MEKVRHGRELTRADVGPAAAVNDGQLLKLIDPQCDLLALLRLAPGTDAVEYCCVFAPAERR